MSYILEALVGKSDTLTTERSSKQNVRILSLGQDIAMIPISDELREEIGNSGQIEKFNRLSPEIEDWARQISAAGLVAYIEAEYFGGEGTQSAVVWNAGARMFEPIHRKDSINRVLKLLGVSRNNAIDEFEAIGLGKHRFTGQWK